MLCRNNTWCSTTLHYRQNRRKTKNKRIDKLLLSITIHNIPEGAAIGVAFGALALNNSPESVMKALTLAIGIGIQNFPEGLAISFPMLKKVKLNLNHS